MSYDLMVFDPAVAPRERPAFVEWYHKQAEWSEEHSDDDAANTTPALRAWYEEIRKTYPNMNGPGAPTDEDLMKPGVEDNLADYSVGQHVIYAAFPWSQAEKVYPLVRSLAVKYGVGFYDVSGDEGDGEIHFPGQELKPESQGAWRQIARDSKELDNQ
jgi:hypothetical protein